MQAHRRTVAPPHLSDRARPRSRGGRIGRDARHSAIRLCGLLLRLVRAGK
jgi:hypothetical protein